MNQIPENQDLVSQSSSNESIITLESQIKQHIENPIDFPNNPLTNNFIKTLEEQNEFDEMSPEEVNQIIKDSDIRFQTACRNANNHITLMDEQTLKPEYQNYQILIYATQIITHMVLLFVIFILGFSRPEWCIHNEFITDDCKRTLQPGNERSFVLGKLPIVIDGEERNILLILCGVMFQLTNFIKLKFCVPNKKEQVIFYLMLSMNVLQIILFTLLQLDIFTIKIMDILIVFQMILGVPILKNNFENLINVVKNTKEIFIFCFLFIFAFSAACFVFFAHIKDSSNNGNLGSCSEFNFNYFSTSFYSVIITTLLSSNVQSIVSFMQHYYKLGIILILILAFVSKIFIQNLLVSLMYSNYVSTFKDDVKNISQNYPELSIQIKREIINKKLNIDRLHQIVQRAYLKKKLDKEFLALHIYIEKTTQYVDKQISTDNSLKFKFKKIFDSKIYIIIAGLVDVFQLINISLSNEFESDDVSIFTHINFFLINIYFIQSLVNLTIKGFQLTSENILDYIGIISTLFGTSFYFFNLIFQYHDQIDQEIHVKNQIYMKAFNILIIFNSWNFIRMLFLNDLIKTLFEVILKSLGYIIDIFFIMITLTIIYAALGMMLFGGEVYVGTTDLVNELSKTTTFDEKIFDGLNFNDYYNSLQTLIIILVSDYVSIAQINNNLEKGKIYLSIYLFHISFTILSKICLLNIIFGFLIDNCQSYLVEFLGQKIDQNEKENQIQERIYLRRLSKNA